MKELTYYELVKKTEAKILAKAHKVPKGSEALEEVVRLYTEDTSKNTKDYYRVFYDVFLKPNMAQPVRYRAVPFFEITWLMLFYGLGSKSKEEAVTDLLLWFDGLSGKTLTSNYGHFFDEIHTQGNAVSQKIFRQIVNDARGGRAIGLLKKSTYRKLICMFTQVVMKIPKLKKRYTLWREAALLLLPGMESLIQDIPEDEMKSDIRARVAVIGNVGLADAPEYTPFISVNAPGIFMALYGAITATYRDMPWRKTRDDLCWPIVHTQAMLMVAMAESKEAPDGVSPATHLSKRLEVVENERRMKGPIRVQSV